MDTGSSGNLRTLGNINTDTGSSGNLRTLGNTNTDTGSSQNPWTVGNTNTCTHVHECTHRLLYKCSSDVHMHNAAYKHRFQANTILQSLDTHTLNTKKTDTIIPRYKHIYNKTVTAPRENTPTKTHYCESV